MSKCPKIRCKYNKLFKCINNKDYKRDCKEDNQSGIVFDASIVEDYDIYEEEIQELCECDTECENCEDCSTFNDDFGGCEDNE